MMGHATKTVRVELKPPAGGAVDAYLALVARDRPGSTASPGGLYLQTRPAR